MPELTVQQWIFLASMLVLGVISLIERIKKQSDQAGRSRREPEIAVEKREEKAAGSTVRMPRQADAPSRIPRPAEAPPARAKEGKPSSPAATRTAPLPAGPMVAVPRERTRTARVSAAEARHGIVLMTVLGPCRGFGGERGDQDVG